MIEGKTGGPIFEGSRVRILLVEDEPLISENLARCFGRVGYDVVVAHTVLEAEGAACGGSFHCGIFDVELAWDDGIALAERLVVRGAVRGVVFFSGTSDGDARRRAARVGAFVSKTAQFEELEMAVRDSVLGAI